MSGTSRLILKNLLIFAAIVAILIVSTMAALNKYTHHDLLIKVPDVRTLTVGEAAPFLEKKNLRYKVVDSIRIASQLPGAILDQKPDPGSHVKDNRIVFLTINASSEEKICMPDVKDCSQRQAVAVLEAIGIRVRGVEYMPSEFRDLVLGVLYRGRNIPAGYKLPKGSYVTLMVGQSVLATEESVEVPSLHGLFLEEAIEDAHAKSLNIGNIHYDVTPANTDEAKKYQVYKQDPKTGSSMGIGGKIDLWMTTEVELIATPEEIFVPEDSMDRE